VRTLSSIAGLASLLCRLNIALRPSDDFQRSNLYEARIHVDRAEDDFGGQPIYGRGVREASSLDRAQVKADMGATV